MKQKSNFLLPTRFVKPFRLAFAFLICIVSLKLNAQEAAVKDIGLVDVTSNGEVKIGDFSNKKAITVIFFCDSCPYATFYINRIKQFVVDYSDVQFLLVNSSDSEFVPEESEANMAKMMKESGMGIPYLDDKDKRLLKAFNARKCPEVFVLTPGNWNTAYHGAIDNNPQVEADVSEFYLKDALEQILAGKAVTTDYVRPSGCNIK